VYCSQIKSLFLLLPFLLPPFLFSFFPSCNASIATSHSSSHTFNPINDTHWEKVVTPITYSWDVESTHDLIYSKIFSNFLK
jgi:hypothetical protein